MIVRRTFRSIAYELCELERLSFQSTDTGLAVLDVVKSYRTIEFLMKAGSVFVVMSPEDIKLQQLQEFIKPLQLSVMSLDENRVQ